MAKATKKSKTVDKWKRKKWYTIISPKMLREVEIGETPASDTKNMVGKTIKINLSQILGVKNQKINTKFQVFKLVGTTAHTFLTEYEVVPAFIKRMVRHNNTRIDDSFTAISQDGIKIRIKPFVLTKGKISKLKATEMRHTIRKSLIQFIEQTSYNDFAYMVVTNKLQAAVYKQISKVTGVKIFVIRVFKREAGEPESDSLSGKKPEEILAVFEEKKPVNKESKKEETPKKEQKVPGEDEE